ncbi:hypothetical protein [Streptomyces sp. CRN 30]|uniref:hypothetical protein n=1 Tax=Streptomyces sp. CRN 30 TaxID=3075613 RepID=UPI002A837061|nr:hypothetical protein [Streptomyces sp. CRN 30]
MSPRPLLKRQFDPAPTGPRTARPAAAPAAVGEPEDVARQGVLSALRPDPRPTDGRYPVAWLTIVAPYGATPTATSQCQCGRDRSATGPAEVLALITDHHTHRTACPLRTPQEGRAAA